MQRPPKAKPTSIDDYLAGVSADKRRALEALRATIRAAAPEAVECIAYSIPAFRLNGRVLVAFAAAAKHCAFHAGAHPIRTHTHQLAAFDVSKGTIRFQSDRPLAAALVRELVATRIAEHSR